MKNTTRQSTPCSIFASTPGNGHTNVHSARKLSRHHRYFALMCGSIAVKNLLSARTAANHLRHMQLTTATFDAPMVPLRTDVSHSHEHLPKLIAMYSVYR
ncbi:hypothetical protein ANCCAN_18563 [Ancylostoma caninum]|uniref:Uncharacterized protein n=1 Tax=Ancylostoma caninum TaxID=29170 RepID=A0A368FXN5_ANCCA|nr:hypothetical protein ANCCAN_18563 [Ancylostoma caninum]